MRTIYSFLLAMLCVVAYTQSSQVHKGTYFGQEPPGLQAKLFAPDLLNAEHGYHSSVVFSKDMKMAVWSPMGRENILMYSKCIDDVWTAPIEMRFGLDYGVGDATFSPDGKRLYFLSFHPSKPGAPGIERIWYVDKTKEGWTNAVVLPDYINDHRTHWTFSVAESGNLYFTSESAEVRGFQDIYMAEWDGKQYLEPVNLGDAINSDGKDLACCVAPDESYIIISRVGEDTQKADMYISYKNEKGNWQPAKDMGPPFNTKEHDMCPALSPDGKYLFFISRRSGNSLIYWVSTEAIPVF